MKKDFGQEHDLLEIKIPEKAVDIFRQVIEFLQLFLPVTLVKRFVTAIFLAINMSVRDAMELTGLCEKSMCTLKKQLREKPVTDLVTIKFGSVHRRKSAVIEKQILAELELGNCYTRQEIMA